MEHHTRWRLQLKAAYGGTIVRVDSPMKFRCSRTQCWPVVLELEFLSFEKDLMKVDSEYNTLPKCLSWQVTVDPVSGSQFCAEIQRSRVIAGRVSVLRKSRVEKNLHWINFQKRTSGLIVDAFSRRLCFPFRSECAEVRRLFFPGLYEGEWWKHSNSLWIFMLFVHSFWAKYKGTDEPTMIKSQAVCCM